MDFLKMLASAKCGNGLSIKFIMLMALVIDVNIVE